MADLNRPQNFENHSHPIKLFLFAGILLAINLGFHIYVTIKNFSPDGLVGIMTGAALLMVWAFSRFNALKMQDRIIRMEMRYRLEKLLPAEKHTEISKLKLSQLVALRFAGDAELPGLFDQALAGKFEKSKDIKLAIKDWQADWLRV